MDVYNIEKLIQLLQEQQRSGLFYTNIQDIKEMLVEVRHDPPGITDSTGAIERLDSHVTRGYNIPFNAPIMYSMLLQISESKCLRWRKNGAIASVHPGVLLSQLKELDRNSKLKRTLCKAYKHGKKIFSEKTMYHDVNTRTRKKLIGLSTSEYKELKAKRYIIGKTLKDVLGDVHTFIKDSI